MELKGKTIGFALTGSFCTYKKVIPEIKKLREMDANIIPIMSEISFETDTRFGKISDFKEEIESICENKIKSITLFIITDTNNKIISSIREAEPIGPKKLLDILLIAPCTGNTISKIANGIADSTVTLSVKSHLRNLRPVVLAVSTNDGLGGNAGHIGILLNRKNIFFVPYGQDDYMEKPNSLVADMSLIPDTLISALCNTPIEPLLISY